MLQREYPPGQWEGNIMQITEVQIFPVRQGDERLKAFATLTIDNCFVVRDLKIINGNRGLFVAMPSRRKADGEYVDVAHPLDSATRTVIENAVIGEYSRVMDGASDHAVPRRLLEVEPQKVTAF